MTPSDKLREIAVKFFPTEEKLSNNSLYNQLQQSSQDKLLSDLTALISEHYYPKEKYNELLRQRDELKEENEKLKRQIQSYNPYPNRPNPRDINPYDIGSVKRARRGR